VNSNSVNINDTESPVAMANDPTLYLDENGMASITGEMVNNESSDNCGGTNLSFTLETSSFDCSNLGENEVIFTAMDASGNADTDTITITVLDSLAPSLTCPGNIISTECNNITFATPTIGDNCSTTGTPMQTEGIASGEVFPIGETLITYTFMDDSNNPSSCSFTVTINSSLEINVDSIIGSSGANDGGINVSINGGSGNYTFEWMENDAIIANSEDLSNVGPGLYELRFENGFEFHCNIDSTINVNAIHIPPMIIQPYIENAIWHGLLHKEDPGKLDLVFSQSGKYLEIIIDDNGIGRKAARQLKSKSVSKYKSMGMKITEDRIRLLNELKNLKVEVVVIDKLSNDQLPLGTKVKLTLPILSNDEM
ncbi:MAG: HYR domain-containing protein, partial [Bacteroidota bacterium]